MPKRQIRICLGSSCFSRGNNTNLGAIKKYLSENNLGPIIRIDDKVYEEVNLSRLYKILQEEFPCN